mmetsp:Transcript_59345/g.145159  ORF Transcript_59345/g.145159 Transcript_59345/m.145159 type:complete len:254 (+) Transcript_59345:409-1170(+)
MSWVDTFTGRPVDVKIGLFNDRFPIIILIVEFCYVALDHFIQFMPVTPQTRLNSIRVLCMGWNLYDRNNIMEPKFIINLSTTLIVVIARILSGWWWRRSCRGGVLRVASIANNIVIGIDIDIFIINIIQRRLKVPSRIVQGRSCRSYYRPGYYTTSSTTTTTTTGGVDVGVVGVQWTPAGSGSTNTNTKERHVRMMTNMLWLDGTVSIRIIPDMLMMKTVMMMMMSFLLTIGTAPSPSQGLTTFIGFQLTEHP